jgi:AhpD family alkylhydroperoxidase
VTRIDLLTSPGCPACPAAREAVRAFAARRPGVEVHEWDLTHDPGPARGRGIFATPAVIVDGERIVVGVPTARDLEAARSRPHGGTGGEEGEASVTRDAAVSEIFEAVRKRYGFVPNQIQQMSVSPAVARVYLGGQEAMAEASLSARDQQVVELAVSVYNDCAYCRAAHRTGARAAGVAAGDVAAIEKGDRAEEPRVRALASATWEVMNMRGWLGRPDLERLAAEGIGLPQLYEIVALVGLKTISNYVNHIAHTEIDEAFRG